MATTRYGDYFAGTEYYVDYSAGTDDLAAGRGDTDGDPWQTLKYAIETGITRNSSTGDRINLKGNVTHTVAATASLSDYVVSASEAAPLLIQGYTSAANDGGIAYLAGSVKLWDGVIFSYLGLQDLHVDVTVDSGGAFVNDRNGTYINVYCKNSSNVTNAPACEVDGVSSVWIDCYFEGNTVNTWSLMGTGISNSMQGIGCMMVQRGTGGIVSAYGTGAPTSHNSLYVHEGNAQSNYAAMSNSSINCAAICLGTPGSVSYGWRGSDRCIVSGCYFENYGYAIGGGHSTYTSQYVKNNSFYNCGNAMVSWVGKPGYVEAPVDTVESIFTDTDHALAADCDFTINQNSVDNQAVTRGFVDPNDSSNNKTFQTFVDASGLGTITETVAGAIVNQGLHAIESGITA